MIWVGLRPNFLANPQDRLCGLCCTRSPGTAKRLPPHSREDPHRHERLRAIQSEDECSERFVWKLLELSAFLVPGTAGIAKSWPMEMGRNWDKLPSLITLLQNRPSHLPSYPCIFLSISSFTHSTIKLFFWNSNYAFLDWCSVVQACVFHGVRYNFCRYTTCGNRLQSSTFRPPCFDPALLM